MVKGAALASKVAGSVAREPASAKPKAKAKAHAGVLTVKAGRLAKPKPKAEAEASLVKKPDKSKAAQCKLKAATETDPLDNILQDLLGVVGPQRVQVFREHIFKLGGLRLGSGCTGSNVTLAFTSKAFDVLGLELIRDLFSYELNPAKQKFIKWVNERCTKHSGHVFRDLRDLSSSSAPCVAHPEERCPIPSKVLGTESPIIVWIGFSCKSLSKLFNVSSGTQRVQWPMWL